MMMRAFPEEKRTVIDENVVRVGTYNVHGWIGTDSQQMPRRTIEVIHEMGCDLVGLQEATFSLEKGKDFNAAYLRQMSGMEPVLGPTLYKSPMYFGNILLTRFPVIHVDRYDLTVSTFEHRGALDVRLRCGSTTVRVLVTHLGLKIRERRHQMKLLLDLLGQKTDDRIILMGDFNEWFLPRYAHWKLHSLFGHVKAPRTFPSIFPLLAIDRIWVYPRHAMTEISSWKTALSRVASDHLPVQAMLSLT